MKDIKNINYHPVAEDLVKILCQKTGSEEKIFFRVLVAYYFTKITSMMRVNIKTHDRGEIPINMYAINLAPSGLGKGYSTNIVEEQVIHKFRERFLAETFAASAEANLQKLAAERGAKKDIDPEVEIITTTSEFNQLGELMFSFDSATPAAVKQMRHKLLMANAGSMNMEIDEIGSNLLGNKDVIDVFFELFDVGKVKQKLVKNTSDNTRNAEIIGRTPTNMMLFGTPTKLFDGGKVEEETITMFETGMARRCFFGICEKTAHDTTLTPAQIYKIQTDTSTAAYLIQLADKFNILADPVNFGITLEMSEAVSLLLIEYKLECERKANALNPHEHIRKAEIAHRYFKVLKLAGTYAFIDGSPDVLEDHIYNAIKLAEASGDAFDKLMTRDRNYVKLAKYIANVDREVTHVDIVEDLPFYKGSETQKREMMNLAIAWGYKNNTVIKKIFADGIEFLKGESLDETDISKITLSCSTDIATGYKNHDIPFDALHKMTQLNGYHWVAHHFVDEHRREDSIKQGFNLVVLDVDENVTIDTAKLLLKDYKYLIYTTKRHTDKKNRFRIVLPMSHKLEMAKSDYTEFMRNVFEWLPFDVDTSTVDRCRKWLSHPGSYEYNDGKLLNSLLFIPKTAKNDERKKFIADNNSLSNMERWFCNKTGVGNRSNQLIKYALMLVDSGLDFNTVQAHVFSLNNKLQDKMTEAELLSTVLSTTHKAILKRDTQ
jgi:hypothetical protein